MAVSYSTQASLRRVGPPLLVLVVHAEAIDAVHRADDHAARQLGEGATELVPQFLLINVGLTQGRIDGDASADFGRLRAVCQRQAPERSPRPRRDAGAATRGWFAGAVPPISA